MTKKGLPKHSRKIGIGLLLGSLLVLIGIFLPWMSINFVWSFPDGSHGTIEYKVNGLGLGTTSVNVTFTNQSYNYSEMKTTDVFLPSVLPLGGVIGSIAILNIVFSVFLIIRHIHIFPQPIQKWIQKHPLPLLLFNSISLLIPLLVFSRNYFNYSIYSVLSQVQKPGLGASPAFFSASSPSLFNFYKSFFSYLTWIKGSTQNPFASVLKRNFLPGTGFFLVWLGGLILIYTWFIRVMIAEEWPKVWQKRGALLPLMISLTFLPSGLVITSHNASLFPLLFSNILFRYEGAIYFLLTFLLLFLNREVALTEKTISQRIRSLLVKSDVPSEGVSKITELLQQKQKKAKYLRIAIGILHICLVLFVGTLFYFYLNFYINFYNVLEESLRIMRHTFWNWPLFFSPLVSLLINLIFVHGKQ